MRRRKSPEGGTMKGSIQYKEATGKYYPVIYDKETKKHKWGKGHKSQREAERELRSMIRKYDSGSIVFGKKDLFSTVYKEFDETVIPERYKSEGQRRTIRGNFRKHILPVFGNARVDHPAKDEEGKWIHEEAPTSPATKRKILQGLNAFFETCISWGMVAKEENPCEGIQLRSEVVLVPWYLLHP